MASRGKETKLYAEDNDEDGGEQAIQYRYLTFETELPQPTSITPRSPNAPLPPAPPDLKKFTSPFLWSEAQKRFIIWLSVIATAFTAFSAGAYSPGLEQMTKHWGVSDVAVLTGITTFTTGFGLAPMVLAPFSEINGRVSWDIRSRDEVSDSFTTETFVHRIRSTVRDRSAVLCSYANLCRVDRLKIRCRRGWFDI